MVINKNIMYGGGPVVNQQLDLNHPNAIVINNAGFVFVADTDNHCIRVFSPNPDYTLIHILGTPGIQNNNKYSFHYPRGLAIDNNILYVADAQNHRIQVFRITINDNNTITAIHLPGRNGSPHSIGTGVERNTNNTFNHPRRIAIDNDILYVADSNNHRIQVFLITINDNSTITATHLPGQLGSQHSIGTGIRGNTDYTFNYINGLTIRNNILYVADSNNHRIQVFRITINDNSTITATHLPGQLGSQHSIGTGIRGNTDYTFNYINGLTIRNNILYVADASNHRIQVFRITINDNNIISATHLPGANGGPHSIGRGIIGNTNNTFHYTYGLTIHRHNDQDILYVADTYNNRIQVFNGDLTNPATIQYYDSIPPPPPKYTILTQNRMIPLQIRNTRCMFCNFIVCTPTPHNTNNNVNGYIVKLDTAQPRYFHYTCIYNYIISHNAVDISQVGCRVNKHDTPRLITNSLNNNNFEGTDFFSPDFKMLRREIDVHLNIRDTPCRLCRFPLCSRVIDTNNNLNGYVLHLHTITQPNTFYYHYKCISKYFIQIMLSASPYKSPHCATIMDRDDIDKLSNIDRKADAVNGNGFYID